VRRFASRGARWDTMQFVIVWLTFFFVANELEYDNFKCKCLEVIVEFVKGGVNYFERRTLTQED